MKARVLITLAAMTFIAGTVYVAAEGAGPPSVPPGKTEPKSEPVPKADPKGKPDPKGKQADPKSTEPKADPKSKDAPPKTGEKPKPTDPKTTEPKAKDAPPKNGDKAPKVDPKATDKAPKDPKAGQKDPKASEKAPDGGKTTITTQQRTEIRQVIVKSGNAPRVTNVNFTVSIGTIVPRTVTVVVLPPRVIEIYPAWRGYRYFLIGDRIIIIDDEYRIVFIIDA